MVVGCEGWAAVAENEHKLKSEADHKHKVLSFAIQGGGRITGNFFFKFIFLPAIPIHLLLVTL